LSTKKLTEDEELQKAIQESLKNETKTKYKQLTTAEQMKIALQESKKDYLSEDDQIRLAMMASLDSSSCNTKKEESDDESNSDISDDESDYVYDSDSSLDVEITKKKPGKTVIEKPKPVSYSVAFDLRVLINELDDPIKIYSCVYFLNDKQKKRAMTQFKKVDPRTKTGEIFSQNLAYYKSAAQDIDISRYLHRLDQIAKQKKK
jgi:hypothetical protein